MTNNINWLTVFNLSVINYLIILLLLTQISCNFVIKYFLLCSFKHLLILFFPLRNIPVRTIDLNDDFMIFSESSLRRRHHSHSHPYCLTDR